MRYIYIDQLEGRIVLTDELHVDKENLNHPALYKLLWVEEGTLHLVVDHVEQVLHQGEFLSVSSMHQLEFGAVQGRYVVVLFNAPFYSVYRHSVKVSCDGVLFNATAHALLLRMETATLDSLRSVVREMETEFSTGDDDLRGEMLRVLLKRLIIFCTRQAIVQLPEGGKEEVSEREVIRRYYVLVNSLFREKKKVKEYANLLHRSPKTLSNLFALYYLPSPLYIIHARLLMEAKHLLLNTDESNKEIAAQLGFENVSTFSRFFKRMTGRTLTEFRMAGR